MFVEKTTFTGFKKSMNKVAGFLHLIILLIHNLFKENKLAFLLLKS